MIELGRAGAPGELEQRLRSVLRDPTLTVLHWSDASGAYLDGYGTLLNDVRGILRAAVLQASGREIDVGVRLTQPTGRRIWHVSMIGRNSL